MIQNVSGASALLSHLLSQNASPGAIGLAGGAGAAGGITGSSTAQDLQSFMSALIQELRASGTAANGTAATSGASSGSSIALAAAHHGRGAHGHAQPGPALDALLQQIGSSGAVASLTAGRGLAAGALAAGAGAGAGAGSAGLQAAFQRLMQDLASLQKSRSTMYASA